MRLRTIGTLVMLLVSITIARMQDNPASSSGAVMYDAETGSVYTINADGIQPFADVFAAPPWYDSSIPAYNFRISPDHARLLFNYPDESGIQTYYSADVNTGECCVALDPHDPQLDTIYAPSGAFSPDGTQFAASYQNSSAEIPPQIVVFDLTTGDVVGRLPADRCFCQPMLLPDQGGLYVSLAGDRCAARFTGNFVQPE
jgi:WD40 repeat protein